jgi:hypothetical protein
MIHRSRRAESTSGQTPIRTDRDCGSFMPAATSTNAAWARRTSSMGRRRRRPNSVRFTDRVVRRKIGSPSSRSRLAMPLDSVDCVT